MKQLFTILIFFIFSSCIPVRVAPSIKEDKVMVGKKFRRSLPKDYVFIFEDPKDANEFYDFINIKYDLAHQNVERNVPVVINDKNYFLSFYEIEIPTKTVNLVPLMIDAVIASEDGPPLFEDQHSWRIGNWYLGLTVADSNINDCLEPNYKSRKEVLNYLRDLRQEYLDTHNYFEALLKGKP
ncbi:hypothetical protein [Spongiimicrobium sp. 3-5]|uniref:hypothetical protein n=1 Tax=Spongiimicrobium sp. 3-5 TaxID=3332596 RepID=UPI00397EC78A